MSLLDTRTRVDLDNAVTEGTSFLIEFQHFQADEVTPETVTGIWNIVLSKDEEGKLISLRDTLEVEGNIVRWTKNSITNTIKSGKYFYAITQTETLDKSLVYYGVISVNVNVGK